MDKHICRNCGTVYQYCRGCLISPVSYKENGFCSKECYEAFKNKQIEEVVQKDVEVVVNNEDIPTS